MAGKLWNRIGPEVIVIGILIAIPLLYYIGGELLEEDYDAEWSGTWKIETHDTGDLLCQTITVKNVGNEPFSVRIEDWNVGLDGKQYSPNVIASYFRGFSETEIQPGLSHTFVLLYDVPKGLVASECYLYYLGDQDVRMAE